MRRLINATVMAAAGAGLALFPLVALAEGPAGHAAGAAAQGRAVPTPPDMSMILLLTALALTAVLVTATLGYLYRRERHLDWPFQAADVPHDDHH